MSLKLQEFIDTLCQEPYRIFFPLGVLFGMLGVSHWLFYSLGWTKTYSGFYHSSLQMMGYMASFVTGFLLTAMPRFSSTVHASKKEVGGFLSLMLGIYVFLSFGLWVPGECCFIAWLITLGRFGIKRFAKRDKTTSTPPMEFLWVPIAILHGITGTVLLILGQAKILPGWAIRVGKPMMEQGFILSVVLGVGGFLVPRIIGTFKVVAQ